MRGRWRGLRVVGAVAGMIAATVVAAPAVSSAPGDGVSIRPVSLTVDGETATGRVYEPEGGARGLIVAVHGHDGSASDFPEYMSSIVKQTGAALISMDQRSDDSVWRTGEWNVWAGWRDTLAATRWYRGDHPGGPTVLWGWSQGGVTSGLTAAYAPPGTFDYWVDTFGHAGDFSAWLLANLAGKPLRPEIERDAGGCIPLTCPQSYLDRSPSLLANRIDVKRAVLLHGTSDALVPYTSSLEMRAALTFSGKPVSMYTVVSGRDLDGRIVPGEHGINPVFFESGCVVQRLLLGTEPMGGDHDYLIDVGAGIDTAPPAPPNAKCAA
ncbi:alpha/beta hydrolase family protein [Nocardia seriolae]|uniref:alpha/beta hydrolase family protein n=1 Tax=Nocardia seriolae TaxID=37332 RepID=UPI00117EAB04|nr:prolyl oligopeptidase family serine peptidase [Nocardia seriolae]MTJ75997.1 dipeptidyl aminopeptidase [Nocardia seriolae]MTJ87320.1 dipeptidyl aminopeptidase [Nocardia seriolae]MTK31314.1 dipeptidyl aminopeptidase [Nocardia seriolae]MTK47888.1 dipeptidyl aminopeptidase [Nocardia seriolae]MTL12901.1 dipeptidyl aminopeptidase [Nocardia seriolae]